MRFSIKNVLVIAYYFPPMGGVEVQRTVKYVKNLRHYNWQPFVLTNSDGWHYEYDASLLDEIPDHVQIYRANMHDYPHRIRQLEAMRGNGSTSSNQSSIRKVTARVRHFFEVYFNKWILIPDDKNRWLLPAIVRGLRIIHRHYIQVIYVTGPPFTCFLIGVILKLLSRKPLVLDYRDPWTLHPMNVKTRNVDRLIEKWVLRNADRVIFATENLKKSYADHAPKTCVHKFVCIRNGFEDTPFINDIEIPPNDRFTVTYTGSFTFLNKIDEKRRHPWYFLTAIQELIQQNQISRDQIRIQFVGRIGENVIQMIEKLRLHDVVEIVHNVSHAEALLYQRRSDLLLLITMDRPGAEIFAPAKLYEYLAAGKPVLETGPVGSESSQILEELNCGVFCRLADIECIKTTVLRCLQGKYAFNLKADLSQYTLSHLTSMLADQLNRVVGE